MINANELRIGNWVNFTGNGNDNFIVVKELWKRELVSDYMGNELCLFYTEDDLRPIPLTPEILEKCGFEKHDTENCLFIYLHKHELDVDKITVSNNDGIVRIEIPGRRDSCMLQPHIKYLHQLQNLIHALTQTELEIKL